MNVRQLAPKTIRSGRLAPNSRLLVDQKMHNFPSRHEQHEGDCCFTFSAAKRYQQPIACCYEKYLAFFRCGFLGGNENFAQIRTGSLSRLAAFAARFREHSVLQFSKGLISNQKEIYI